MDIAQFMSYLQEGDIDHLMDQYRAIGPWLSILLAFLLSFIPPLPTMVVIGLNVAAFGLWSGILYSWIGVMSGAILVFWLVRKLSHYKYIDRFSHNKGVQKSIRWMKKNGFMYIFMFSLLPVGLFTLLHVAAGLSGIKFRSFAIAAGLGRGIMIFIVSFIGADWASYFQQPWKLFIVAAFVIVGFIFIRKVEAWFSKREESEVLDIEPEPQACKSS
ncbi:TVP38/TMEM64 family protein [Paenibacillus sp. PK4536]|uniref:TVP38/TMEM64 family protein n=1 Tax=Paenibacillus TaxID=44249 RepID=UPI0023582B1D|nr:MULTISPECIES: TVP38/TMEM64 family protein [Paenibacillus]WIM41101.1 TVP38/TMEM64 family protein [Paenibacillus sp. PK4536]CAJ1316547.1 TVP38/TMEM64 family membrane protein [Paenibacillus nuruki]